jgi:hypothetical protein
MRLSRWRSWTRPTPLAPRLVSIALMGVSFARPRASLSYAPSLHLNHLSLSVQGLRPNFFDGEAGRDETPTSRSIRTRQAGRRRGLGRGRGGGGWLSGLSAAAPEAPPDVDSRSTKRGSRQQQEQVSEAKHERGGGEEEGARTRTNRRAMRTWTRRRMGRAAWTRRTRRPGDPKLLSDVTEPLSQGKNGSRCRRFEKKGKGEE